MEREIRKTNENGVKCRTSAAGRLARAKTAGSPLAHFRHLLHTRPI